MSCQEKLKNLNFCSRKANCKIGSKVYCSQHANKIKTNQNSRKRKKIFKDPNIEKKSKLNTSTEIEQAKKQLNIFLNERIQFCDKMRFLPVKNFLFFNTYTSLVYIYTVLAIQLGDSI